MHIYLGRAGEKEDEIVWGFLSFERNSTPIGSLACVVAGLAVDYHLPTAFLLPRFFLNVFPANSVELIGGREKKKKKFPSGEKKIFHSLWKKKFNASEENVHLTISERTRG